MAQIKVSGQIWGTDWPLQIAPYWSPELDVLEVFFIAYFIDMKSTVNNTRG